MKYLTVFITLLLMSGPAMARSGVRMFGSDFFEQVTIPDLVLWSAIALFGISICFNETREAVALGQVREKIVEFAIGYFAAGIFIWAAMGQWVEYFS